MPAVIDRVACPECGAQKGQACEVETVRETVERKGRVIKTTRTHTVRSTFTHDARREALWAANRQEAANVNDRSTP